MTVIRALKLVLDDDSRVALASDDVSAKRSYALLYAYELRQTALRAREAPPAPRAESATDADLARVEETLRSVLRQARFLAGPERHAVRDLAATLRRSRLSRREARLWLAALKRLEQALDARAG